MGGARCTYRTCTVRTDGQTHLFHYPVFDKLRCHQWLTNAQRLYFLNLKVSQLKNKVVCQHHFKEDQFMNYKKDKLTCFAVPTEDGPFCDTNEESLITENDLLSPIKPEYIENEYPFNVNEKRAKFSMKYGDFLTNCDVMETNNGLNSLIIPNFTPKRMTPLRTAKKECKPRPPMNILNEEAYEITKPTLTSHMNNIHQLPQQYNVTKLEQNQSSSISELMKTTATPSKSKITILSEESFNSHIPIPIDTFVTVSPSMVLQAPKGNKKSVDPNAEHYIISLEPYPMGITDPPTNQNDKSGLQEHTPIIAEQNNSAPIITELCNSAPMISELGNPGPIITESNNSVNPIAEAHNAATQIDQIPDLSNTSKGEAAIKEWNINEEREAKQMSSPTLKQNRKSSKRFADIEQKRKFNKKLRDIVEESLNRADENESLLIRPKKRKLQSMEARDPLITYLDARLKQMEHALIQRIDTNSHRIKELQSQFGSPRKESKGARKYSVFTQTTIHDEQTQKKTLYNDISKYLSAEAKSLVFEELFLKKIIKPPLRSSKRNVKT
ncbi:hypothetical protein JYU34_005732 [Plutella xylostella]|uniref:THAP-type domain-containing protein n=1 Tax=Plutella xylostella TaxID=51655 RepID=A0ABQ7QTZ3_PLUXY|nr:hypothetical protein JYU34_005732 [Plutella xylostella]